MCAKKLKYTAGDDLQLYATPKQALEANQRMVEEEKARRRQKYEMKVAQDARFSSRVSSAPSAYTDYKMNQQSLPTSRVSSHYHQMHAAPPSQILPQQKQSEHRHSSLNSGIYTHGSNMNMGTINNHPNNSRPVPIIPPINNRGNGSRSASGSPHRKTSPVLRKEPPKEDRDISVATQLFYNHDVKKKGRLTAEELQNLLQNDDSTRFSISAIDSLINLFGAARFGTINSTEFVSLYKRVKIWRKIYVDNDINGSFTLSLTEYQNSLKELGYMIPFEVGEKLFDQYSEFNIQQNSNSKELKFDKFVESLVWLLQLTKQFRKFDTKQEGVAVIQYKDFIETTLLLGRFLPH